MDEMPRILVVDDDRINVKAISEALRCEYKVMGATNAEQAFRALNSSTPPDLVLLDVMMPDVDGFELCRRIKARPETADTPVIFITSMDSDGDETRGLELGAVDYITKPICPPIVRARVRVHIELRRSLAALGQACETIEAQRDRMEQELKVGQRLQLSLLPEVPSGDGRFEVAASMSPAHEVSGDFYDMFMMSADHIGVCIADVSGKGVPAALFMGMCQAQVRAKSDLSKSPARIVEDVNRAIAANNETCMFVTMVFGVIDLRSGIFSYCNAGHTAPLLLRSGDVIKLEDCHGPAVGVGDFDYVDARFTLQEGDTIMLYTDGVTEATSIDGRLYGEGRLVEWFEGYSVSTPETLIETMFKEVERFEHGNGQSDDLTLLALTYRASRVDDCTESRSLTLRSDDMAVVSDRIGAFLEAINIEEDLYPVLQVVLDEVISNVAQYGYPGREQDFEAGIQVERSADRVTVRVVDSGVHFDPLSVSAPDISSPLLDRDIGGLGVHLCRQFADELTYERRGQKNCFTFVRYLQQAPIRPGDASPPRDRP